MRTVYTAIVLLTTVTAAVAGNARSERTAQTYYVHRTNQATINQQWQQQRAAWVTPDQRGVTRQQYTLRSWAVQNQQRAWQALRPQAPPVAQYGRLQTMDIYRSGRR